MIMNDTVPFPADLLTLTDASILPHSGGEMAAGSVRVTYSVERTEVEITFEVEYDTRAGPDGLHTAVITSPGDSITVWVNGERDRCEAPQRAVDDAGEVFGRYSHEAVTSMPPQTGVCFADIIPVDESDIDEIAG